MIKPIKDIDNVELSEEAPKTELKKAPTTMLQRILSIKNFINVRDENGNFSWVELLASILQIVIAGAVVWGAQELGIWRGLMELLPG